MKVFAAALLLGFAADFGCASSSTGPGIAGGPGGCEGDCGHSGVANGGNAGGGTGSRGGTAATSTSTGANGTGSFGVSAPGSSGSSSGTTGASASSGSSASGGSNSSSGGSTGSNGGNGVCSVLPLPDAGGCPDGYFVSRSVDLLGCNPIVGGTFQALDPNGVPLAGSVLTADDGSFVLCAPPSGAFTPFLVATGYSTNYYPELQAGTKNLHGSLDALSSGDFSLLAGFLPEAQVPADGTMLVRISSSTTCPDPSGWTMWLTDGDGGALPDGGYLGVYVDASDIPDPTLTATSSAGAAFFYNIDVTSLSYVAVGLSKPDAGVCYPTSQTAFGTGRIYVAGESFSIDPLQVVP